MLSISAVLPGFPQARAPWPVWRGSVAGPVRFAAMSRKEAANLRHAARHWNCNTHRKGRHSGVIGRTALDVYEALALDFQNFRTGRLDPSLDAIAYKAGCCRRSVRNALAQLRDLGMITWQRRCEEYRDESGRFRLRQRTNAYRLLPPSQWRGYREPPAPPPPSPDTLGAPERVPDPIEAAVAELTRGQRKAALAALAADPRDPLAAALAAFGQAIDERESGGITGVHGLPRNTSLDSNHDGGSRFAAIKVPSAITEAELEAEKARQLRALFGSDPPG